MGIRPCVPGSRMISLVTYKYRIKVWRFWQRPGYKERQAEESQHTAGPSLLYVFNMNVRYTVQTQTFWFICRNDPVFSSPV